MLDSTMKWLVWYGMVWQGMGSGCQGVRRVRNRGELRGESFSRKFSGPHMIIGKYGDEDEGCMHTPLGFPEVLVYLGKGVKIDKGVGEVVMNDETLG